MYLCIAYVLIIFCLFLILFVTLDMMNVALCKLTKTLYK